MSYLYFVPTNNKNNYFVKKLVKYLVNPTWTEEEKQQLLAALEKYGARNIKQISRCIPSKSIHEIKLAMELYESEAIKSLKTDPTRPPCSRKAPIDRWIEFVKRMQTDSRAAEDIVLALKMISLFEEHTEMEDIKLSDCYEYIADLMVGKVPKKLNPESMNFVMTTFAKFAMKLEEEGFKNQKDFLEKLSVKNILQKTYMNKKASVVCDPVLNTLKIPAGQLKMGKPKLDEESNLRITTLKKC